MEQALDLPVLAMIPMLNETERSIDGRIMPIAKYVALRPQSRFGESIRSARMMAQMSKDEAPPQLDPGHVFNFRRGKNDDRNVAGVFGGGSHRSSAS